MKHNTISRFVPLLTLLLAVPLVAHTQDFQRISLGAHAVGWTVPDLDDFSVALAGEGLLEVREIDQSTLFGLRPFLRFGLIREFDLELSHEFGFGDDVDIMVSAASGILRPFGGKGLELHASICYGQLDWGDEMKFYSAWGWEFGAGYNFKLSDSVSLLVGVAYRDLSFDFEIDKTLDNLAESRPEVTVISPSEESVDAAGFVANAGVSVTF